MSVLRLVLGLSLCLAACGDRSIDPKQPADAAPPRIDGAPLSLPPTVRDCVIAIRVDACCTTAQPVAGSQLQLDPCLLQWPLKPGLDIPAACKAKWTVDCGALDCTWMPGKTRLVSLVGGVCTWKSECTSDAECGAAIDARRCCTCPAGYPRELIAQDPCLESAETPATVFPPPGCTDAADCSMVDCIACPPPATPRCEVTNQSTLRRCTPYVGW
jgi:hypothetical protein